MGMMRRAVREQRVDAMGGCADGVHGQLLPEGFLFTPVGKPVVDSHFRYQIRAEALSFGGGDASLKTLRSAGNRWHKKKLGLMLFGQHLSIKGS